MIDDMELPPKTIKQLLSVLLAKTSDGTFKWTKDTTKRYSLKSNNGVFRLSKDISPETFDEEIFLYADFAGNHSSLVAISNKHEELVRLYLMAYKQNPNVEEFVESFLKEFSD